MQKKNKDKKTIQKGGVLETGLIVSIVFASIIGGCISLMALLIAYMCIKDCCCETIPSCLRGTYGCLITKIKNIISRANGNRVVPQTSQVELTPVEPVPPVVEQGMTRINAIQTSAQATAMVSLNTQASTSTNPDPLYNYFIHSTYLALIAILNVSPSNETEIKNQLRQIFPNPQNVDINEFAKSIIAQLETNLETKTNLETNIVLIEQPNGVTTLGLPEKSPYRVMSNLLYPNRQQQSQQQPQSQSQSQQPQIAPDVVSRANSFVANEPWYIYGGSKQKLQADKIKILGRMRKIIIKDKKKYIKVKGELVLLKDAKKMDKY